MLKNRFAFYFTLTLTHLLVLCGQSIAIDVIGVVKDSITGAALPGVQVIILQTGHNAVTDGSGSYFIAGVTEGFYTFMIGKPNYSPRIMTGVRASASCCIGNRGDINSDGTDANIIDLNYLINKIFRRGPAPECILEADLKVDGIVNILDLNFLVNKIFRRGPVPGPCP